MDLEEQVATQAQEPYKNQKDNNKYKSQMHKPKGKETSRYQKHERESERERDQMVIQYQSQQMVAARSCINLRTDDWTPKYDIFRVSHYLLPK